MLSIIACISKVHRAIGYKNRLLYAIPSDMTRFRMLTTGHTINAMSTISAIFTSLSFLPCDAS